MEVHSTVISSVTPSVSQRMETQRSPHEIHFSLNIIGETIHGISVKGDWAVFGILGYDPEMWLMGFIPSKIILVHWKSGRFCAIQPPSPPVSFTIY